MCAPLLLIAKMCEVVEEVLTFKITQEIITISSHQQNPSPCFGSPEQQIQGAALEKELFITNNQLSELGIRQFTSYSKCK